VNVLMHCAKETPHVTVTPRSTKGMQNNNFLCDQKGWARFSYRHELSNVVSISIELTLS
jgi:hypothetical protein